MGGMEKIQGRRGILDAGAWLAYGFHEDEFTSAVADHIDGVRLAFEIALADRPVQAVFAAHVFDLLEWSGARDVLGKITLEVSRRLALLDDIEHGNGSR